MKEVNGDILNTHLILNHQFTIEVFCHECGFKLNVCDNPSKFGTCNDPLSVYAEPCSICLDNKLKKIKELL